jgi:hypothetical protein
MAPRRRQQAETRTPPPDSDSYWCRCRLCYFTYTRVSKSTFYNHKRLTEAEEARGVGRDGRDGREEQADVGLQVGGNVGAGIQDTQERGPLPAHATEARSTVVSEYIIMYFVVLIFFSRC